jgi:hypothetical protein
MHLNLIAFAVPLFTALMAAEFWLARNQRTRIYHFAEVIANLNVGIGERLADMLTTGVFSGCSKCCTSITGSLLFQLLGLPAYCCFYLLIFSGIGITAWGMK